MGFGVSDKYLSQKLGHHLEKAREQRADSMEKLASGQVFTVNDPRPAERALSEKMEYRLRGLAASRTNVNNAISLLQTAESGLSEINHIILRMKELSITGSNTTVSDQERRYLFIEYEALHDELNRIAVTTEFNGMPLLNGESDRVPEEMIFRIDDPFHEDEGNVQDSNDMNTIRFEGFKSIVATAAGLGINSAKNILLGSSDDGVSLSDAEDMLEPDDDAFATIFDEALNRLSTQRAVFGAMQSRLQKSIDFMEVYQENIAAAKSNIADTDYAREVVKMAESTILMQATSGLLAQNNFDSNITLNLLSSVIK